MKPDLFVEGRKHTEKFNNELKELNILGFQT